MSSDALRSYLRTLRRKQHLTQRQLAAKVGVTEQLIATWERGVLGSLKHDVLLRMANVLHASLEDMIALETGRAVDAEEV
jgi:transcriptional regulator with XRE-family HTH domain